MRLTAPSTGVTQLQLPDNDSGASGLWRYLDDLEIEGATSVRQDGPARRIVTSRANAPFVVPYRVISAFDHDPGADEFDTYKPTIRPHWFWAYGEALFIRIRAPASPGRARQPAIPSPRAWNEMLRAYASSPVRTAPVERIVKDFWTDQNVQQLAYQRGAILAALADARLRAS